VRPDGVGAGERFGRGEGLAGGAMRPGVGAGFRRGGPRTPPDARWAEFAAGKEGGGMEFEALWAEFAAGNEGGGMLFDALWAELAAGNEGGGMLSVPSVRVKDGTALCVEEGRARGVVGEDDFLKVGGVGGGIAARSASSFFGEMTGGSSFVIVGVSSSAS